MLIIDKSLIIVRGQDVRYRGHAPAKAVSYASYLYSAVVREIMTRERNSSGRSDGRDADIGPPTKAARS